jgi:hypothetical protein
MAVLRMPVRADIPAYTFKIDLEGTVYTLGFRHNLRFNCWIMDISDETGNPIVMGTPVQTDVDILGRFIFASLPPGQFMVIDETGQQRNPSRDDFGGEVKLFYAESNEFV